MLLFAIFETVEEKEMRKQKKILQRLENLMKKYLTFIKKRDEENVLARQIKLRDQIAVLKKRINVLVNEARRLKISDLKIKVLISKYVGTLID